MAGRPWTIEEAGETTLTAAFESSPPVLAVFPFPHRLRVTAALTPTALTVTTELTATGVVPVPVAFGWHPLFTLPGVPRERLEVVVPAVRESVLDPRGIPTGAAQERTFADGPLAARTADDEYPAVAGDLVLRGGGRELRVRFGLPRRSPLGAGRPGLRGVGADDRAHQRARHPRRPAQRAAGSQLRGDLHGAGG